MEKLTRIIIGLIILLIVITLIYVAVFDKAQASQVVINSQIIPTDWKTYTDSVSGISLQAPADFTATSGQDVISGANTFSLIIPTTTPYVNTHLLHEARIDIDTPTTTCPQSEQDIFATSTQSTINGISFTRSTTGGVGAGNIYQGVDYTTTMNGLCYRVSLFTHSTNGEGFYTGDKVQIQKIDALQSMDIKDLFALFDQIAGTIKFTK